MIPIELRSAADQISLAINHVASLLPKQHPGQEASTADAIRELGANSDAVQAWMAWRAMVRFRDAWQPFAAAQQPAHGVRPSTMDTGPSQVIVPPDSAWQPA